jgi:cytochrome c peroxidase
MGLGGHEDRFVDLLRNDTNYSRLVSAAFPRDEDAHSLLNGVRAMSAFVRTILGYDSGYDRYLRDMGRLRAPSLRNIAVTAPYMHDGSVPTLEAVIAHYERGGRLLEEEPFAGDGRLSPFKSEFVTGFELADQEREDLLVFLESLTDESVLYDERFSDPFLN